MKKSLSTLNKLRFYSFISTNKTLMILTFLLIMAIFISIFQDYMESERKNYSFFFFESLLFKSFWLLFPPILFFLKYLFKDKKTYTAIETGVIIVASSIAHVLLTALTVWILSLIFREQSYGVVKVLTFTLSNDLVKIILVYVVFIYGFNFLTNNEKSNSQTLDMNHHSDSSIASVKNTQDEKVNSTNSANYLVVNSGKKNIRIHLSDILYIRSATPYVSIQLDDLEYLQSTTLKSITKKLDNRFVRIHRSYIVNIEKVLSYQSRLNGDYDLMLNNGSEIRLSRNYVKDFRSQYESTPQLKT